MRTYLTWMMVFTIAAAPTLVQAQSSVPQKSGSSVQLKNVELTEDGHFQGQVLTESGSPGIAAVKVHASKDGKTVAQAIKTDESGQFTVKGLKPGTFVFTVGDDTYACRVWNHGMAPPKSLQVVAVVPSSEVVLGQSCSTCDPCEKPGLRGRLASMSGTQKALLVGIVAAAIVIPIALDDDDDAS